MRGMIHIIVASVCDIVTFVNFDIVLFKVFVFSETIKL